MKLPDLRVVALDKVYIHEEIFTEKVKIIVKLMEYSGVQKNPILCVEHDGKYVVIDGMHRVAALKDLGCANAGICVKDYYDERLTLGGWAVLFYDIPKKKNYLDLILFITNTKMERMPIDQGIEAVHSREAYFTILFKDDDEAYVFVDKTNHKIPTKDLMAVDKNVMINIEQKEIAHRFITDKGALDIFKKDKDASAVMIRPIYHKDEVIEFALKKQLFPQKSTRHEIPERPLWLNLPLAMLREHVTAEVANDIMQNEINYRWKRGRIRYYPEATFILDD